ncbi:ammonium transporter [Spirochaeta africana]|uniref:Ammonium transporter n=1 Tax=Spirochaeta africana (strain ATCC 700263 / DSM 8902 / Z-7692) TaxID=889378 RepID=H9UKL0_SPIAZ|nr:ammonium transporter [Spirochaeta africana]AFG38053.1 ammonium transporter [Spirochaeta africana DSM 8902]
MNKRTLVLTMVILLVLLTAGNAFALESLAEAELAFDMLWLILAAALVFFMQAGFAMVETGLTRAKNAGNIIMKNLMDFSAGAMMYFAIGWAIMYGTDSIAGLIGLNGWFLSYTEGTLAAYGISSMSELYRDWMFQVVFAATAATIVSGAMAERTKYSGYLIYSVFITGLIYPVFGHWTWGGGWLDGLGFHDFAGSTIVHSVGGWAALVGAFIIGARKGKYVKSNGETTVKAIPGHNLPLAALGVFILWFGWYGFNGGSTLSGVDPDISLVFTTTTLSASGGAIAAMFMTWLWFGKPDPSMSLNGALAGLVGITAGADVVTPLAAILIGLTSGIVVVAAVEFIDKVLHIDDPVGAASVHGVAGAWGTLMVGFFHTEAGLFYGGGFSQIGIQLVGILAAFVWVVITAGILFGALKAMGKLRVEEKDEMQGLDISEHGMESYSGFQIFSTM